MSLDISIQLISIVEVRNFLRISGGDLLLLPRQVLAPDPNAKKKRSANSQGFVYAVSGLVLLLTHIPCIFLHPTFRTESLNVVTKYFAVSMDDPGIDSNDSLTVIRVGHSGEA
jgi:hypothetical protein